MTRLPRNIATALLATLAAGMATAGDDATSLSYISYLERYALVRPAGDAESIEGQINMPILAGDRLETARGSRVEVQLADSTIVWVDEFTTLDFDALAFSREAPADRTALYLVDGTIAVEIPDFALGESSLRLETPTGVVYLHKPGLYRLDLNGAQLHVEARAGLAELPAGVGSSLLRAGQHAWMSPSDGIQRATLDDRGDAFWAWVGDRRSPDASGQTARYIDERAAGRAAILDSYGDWVYVSSFGSWAWRPRVSGAWVPYSHGRWYWTPVGWNWISYEPWGWYPYHYGSWYLDASFGWVWCWDWVWGPAWVHWFYTPGYIGWCPRGYYDWWYWNHYDLGHYRPEWRSRWTRSALDFAGRVRLRDVDPRPWTVVPAGHFTSGRIDRVRMDPGVVFREGAGGREGFVRSGPLVTRTRGVAGPTELFEGRYRATERPTPGLGALLGRGETGGRAPSALPVRNIDTASQVISPERRGTVPGPGTRGDRAPSVLRGRDGDLGRSGTPGSRSPAGRRQVTPGTRAEPPGDSGRNPGSRTAPPAPRRSASPSTPPDPSAGGSSRGSTSPRTSRPSSPPPTTSRPSSPPPTTSRPSNPPTDPPPANPNPPREAGRESRSPGGSSDPTSAAAFRIRSTRSETPSVAPGQADPRTVSGGEAWLKRGESRRTRLLVPNSGTRSRADRSTVSGSAGTKRVYVQRPSSAASQRSSRGPSAAPSPSTSSRRSGSTARSSGAARGRSIGGGSGSSSARSNRSSGSSSRSSAGSSSRSSAGSSSRSSAGSSSRSSGSSSRSSSRNRR